MINIFKGDSTTFANINKFLTFIITTELDLTDWKAEFILGNIKKEINDITSKRFEVVLCDKETSKLRYGVQKGSVRLTDSKGRVKTVSNDILFNITSSVVNNEPQTIDLVIPQMSEVSISLKVGQDGGVTDYEDLTSKPTINGVEVRGEKTPKDLGIFNDDAPSESSTYSSSKIEDILKHPQYGTLRVNVFLTSLGKYKADYSSDYIRNYANGGGTIELYFEDTIRKTGEQIYEYQNYRNGYAYFRRPVIEKDLVSRINIAIDHNKDVLWEEAIFEDYYTRAEIDEKFEKLRQEFLNK